MTEYQRPRIREGKANVLDLVFVAGEMSDQWLVPSGQ